MQTEYNKKRIDNYNIDIIMKIIEEIILLETLNFIIFLPCSNQNWINQNQSGYAQTNSLETPHSIKDQPSSFL